MKHPWFREHQSSWQQQSTELCIHDFNDESADAIDQTDTECAVPHRLERDASSVSSSHAAFMAAASNLIKREEGGARGTHHEESPVRESDKPTKSLAMHNFELHAIKVVESKL